MKKTTLSLIFLFLTTYYLHAQILYGLMPNGGRDGVGSILKYNAANNNLLTIKSFENGGSIPGYTNLIQGTDGKLYGMTRFGGNVNFVNTTSFGVIFSYDPLTAVFTKLKHFDSTEGGFPTGSLMQANDGKLYGTTSSGGINNKGVIFSFDPSLASYIKLKDFDSITGSNPGGSLIQGNDGKLYGMTNFGGIQNRGVIYSFDPTTSTYLKLKEFDEVDGSNGIQPYGNLVQTGDGKLYGITCTGGISNSGVIFSYDIPSLTYTKLKDFSSADGKFPVGDLLLAGDGKLYGMTAYGGSNDFGTIFSFNPTTLVHTKLFDFSGANGRSPQGSLRQAADGKLYGMTEEGGENNIGVIFSYDPLSSNYMKLKDFADSNGARPLGGFMQALDGKLYGMTAYGGNANEGIIFSYHPSSSIFTKLLDFETPEGRFPSASLTYASNGKFYGMTSSGGKYNYGVIYSYDASTSLYQKLIDFNRKDGGEPYGSLIQASDGMLYGMTSIGGSFGGVIFSFNPNTSVYSKLKSMDRCCASGSLVQANNGKLYGMIPDIGTGYWGAIFSFDPLSSVYTPLMNFDYNCGAYPVGNLVQATDGNLYGVTSGGGSGEGVIFSFNISTLTCTKLKDFGSADGAIPYGSLVQAQNGKLYGLTAFGGSKFSGVIFSYDPASSTFTKLIDFDSTNGAYPWGSLMEASDGKLYGMTSGGGSNNTGVIFSYNPADSTFTKLQDLSFHNFYDPYSHSGNQFFGHAFVEIKDKPLPVTIITFTGKKDGANNSLFWKIANEHRISYYELQRGTDPQLFNEIGRANAAGKENYHYEDPITGSWSVFYYRLKIIEADGSFRYSAIVKIENNERAAYELNIAPHPVIQSSNISFNMSQSGKVVLKIIEASGRTVKVLANSRFEKGKHTVLLNSSGIPTGTYFLHFNAGTYSEIKKLSVTK